VPLPDSAELAVPWSGSAHRQVPVHATAGGHFVFRSAGPWDMVYKVLPMDPQAREQARCTVAAEALRRWGVLKLRATGVSMLPTLWPGDLLTVCSCPPEQVGPGEIVLYRRAGRFFIHRVVGKSRVGQESFLVVRGDCMPQEDPPVRSDALMGKVMKIQRRGSVFSPAPRLSPIRRMAGYLLCHWGLVRRVGLRLRGRCHRDDGRLEGVLAGAAS
jgi:signal peptidase I